MVRMSAEERRESVVRAAMSEFARGGYHGTSTEAIARRVGVSQPYLFRLFPNKQAIFLAAAIRCTEEIRDLFARVSDGLSGEAAKEAMAGAYTRLIAEEPERLQMQMQVSLAVADAEAAGDHEFGVRVRATWTDLYDTVRIQLGGNARDATLFLAHGMLINTLSAMGFPLEHRVWEGLAQPDAARGRVEG
ncbi:TetR/AcrR family transcriptional regulator [Streptomyces sp. NRRL S-87]|uniref:TetR/AcrR family transcriptional regulator n=1 Tax=Streptomyces sp. NRRL S-87 TaxID=1463920 RepID=UPI0004C0557A|nr:TetR/AcrR family transcriptional regulator [Streptomyces sp. NRRL S-87]